MPADGILRFVELAPLLEIAFMCCSSRPSRAKETRTGRRLVGAVAIVFGILLAVAAASPPAQAQSAPPPPPPPPPTPPPPPPPPPTPPPPPSPTDINSDLSGGAAVTNLGSNFLERLGNPGLIRVRARAAEQSGRRRRLRSDGRAAFPDVGRGLRNLGQDRRAGRFRRRPASDLGRRRRARRAPCTRRQRRRFG